VSLSGFADSRAATNALLGILRQGRWRPGAIARFTAEAAHRSLHQAASRPQALAQVTALHGLLLALARHRRPGRLWVAASWTLSALHLGLLDHRERLAIADAATLDVADGRLARRQGTVSPFGDYADTLADAAFWTWLTLRHEPSRTVRAAAIAAWALPAVTVTVIAVGRGAMPDRPRPALLRPAAAMQCIVALRHLLRR
jgi:hypothetical protein